MDCPLSRARRVAAAGYGVYSMFSGGKAAAPFQDYTILQITDNTISQAAAISPDGYVLAKSLTEQCPASGAPRSHETATCKSLRPRKGFIPNSIFLRMDITFTSVRRGLPRSINSTSTRASSWGQSPDHCARH